MEGLKGLTPGDFKVVRDRFAFKNKKDITHQALLIALEEEARIKDCHAGVKNIGFLSRSRLVRQMVTSYGVSRFCVRKEFNEIELI